MKAGIPANPKNGRPRVPPSVAARRITEASCTRNIKTAEPKLWDRCFSKLLHKRHARLNGHCRGDAALSTSGTAAKSAACGSAQCRAYPPCWSCGRVAEGGGLLNRYRLVKAYRGFESLRLRQTKLQCDECAISVGDLTR